MEAERKYGRIVWFKNEKGFGFLRPDGAREDDEMFFHWTHISMEGYKTLQPNAKVSFLIGKNHRGPMAVEVQEEPEIDETSEG